MALAVLLTEDGDLDIRNGLQLVSGAEAARGALYYRFSTFAGSSREDPGEWRYDYNYGIQWRNEVFGRYFQTDEIQAMLAEDATETTGVGPVSPGQVSLVTDPRTRKAAVQIVDIPLLNGDTIDFVLLPGKGS
jgi:hypothetical protein